MVIQGIWLNARVFKLWFMRDAPAGNNGLREARIQGTGLEGAAGEERRKAASGSVMMPIKGS